jgi:methionine-rich copper-binding protein CopC
MDVQADVSNIKVFNAVGREVDKKDAKVDPSDGSLMGVSVPQLSSGTYKVVWNAVCPFGHETNGTFTFTVKRA